MFTLRDKKRYGCFSAECDELGKVTVSIEPYGFGELISVCRKGEQVTEVDTLESCVEARYEETDDYLLIDEYTIRKPFGKCLKRY